MTKQKLPSKMFSHNENITNRLNSHELVRITLLENFVLYNNLNTLFKSIKMAYNYAYLVLTQYLRCYLGIISFKIKLTKKHIFIFNEVFTYFLKIKRMRFIYLL